MVKIQMWEAKKQQREKKCGGDNRVGWEDYENLSSFIFTEENENRVQSEIQVSVSPPWVTS